MSANERDHRFFGPGFQDKLPEASQVVEDVGALADEIIARYGVPSFEELPREAVEEFEEELLKREWSIPKRENLDEQEN